MVLARILFFLIITSLSLTSQAGNLIINSVKWKDAQNAELVVSWQYSWNLAAKSAPFNHDAAYVFAKVSTSNSGFSNLLIEDISTNTNDVKLLKRSIGFLVITDNQSITSINSCRIVVHLAKPLQTGKNDVRWFGIEMAYVPKADSIYIGDGVSNNALCQKDGKPVLLKLISAVFSNGDSVSEMSKPEPFYLMKYEVSQRQYADFLNTLTASQQKKRIESTVYSNTGVNSFTNAAQNRNGIELEVPFENDEPAVFITKNPYVACNGLNTADVLAYLCWAGLRPMSEIEFEYAARGSNIPKAKEGAWGNSNCEDVNSLNDSNLVSEIYKTISLDSSAGKANYGLPVGTQYLQGPGRSGALFTSNSNRVSAGAGYFGHADLSGNVWELCIAVPYVNMNIGLGTGNIEDLDNGTLVWPNNENGYIYRGGGWNSIVLNRLSYPFRDIAISDRFYAGYDVNIRRNTTGGRGAL